MTRPSAETRADLESAITQETYGEGVGGGHLDGMLIVRTAALLGRHHGNLQSAAVFACPRTC